MNGLSALVLGDIILDEYVYGTVDRLSPEGPFPVLDLDLNKKHEFRLGGAANVANNLKKLGFENVYLAGIGNENIFHLCGVNNISVDFMLNFQHDTQLMKTRFVDLKSMHQLLRVDNVRYINKKNSKHFFDFFKNKFEDLKKRFNLILVSDYCKGTLDFFDKTYMNRMLKFFDVSLIDTKNNDISNFLNFNILKVNNNEFDKIFLKNDLSAFDSIVVTKGKEGMSIIEFDKQLGKYSSRLIPQEDSLNVVDVCGAGDTVMAALGFSLIKHGLGIDEACSFANKAAAYVVKKFGTEVPNM